jgi:hypothetical protein
MNPVISTNSMLSVFAASYGNWSGFCLVGMGTNTILWATDATPGGLGIEKFSVQPDGTFDPSAGIQVVAVGGSPGLDNDPFSGVYPFAVAMDKAGAIYTAQYCSDQVSLDALAFRFPAYNPATNSGLPELDAAWAAGPGNGGEYCGGYGIAVDPTGTNVAACFRGWLDANNNWNSGNIKILNAADGAVVTNLDLGVAYTNNLTSDPTDHQDIDADWDAVGNLYYLDDLPGCWRAFSPPGTNQATTVALPVVQVIASVQPPYITSTGVSAGTVTIYFTGGSGDPAWAFLLLSAPAAGGPYTPAAGAVITGSDGSFKATVAASGPMQFYRILRLGTIPLYITNLRVAGETVTVNFTGSPSDSPSAFTLLSSAAVNGTYATAAGAVITGSGGSFQATVPTNGPTQFYRIGK